MPGGRDAGSRHLGVIGERERGRVGQHEGQARHDSNIGTTTTADRRSDDGRRRAAAAAIDLSPARGRPAEARRPH